MGKAALVQNQFTQGELGPYMLGRSDNAIYHAGAKTLENWLVLPQGGVQRRRGFAFVDTITPATIQEARLINFNVGSTLQYLLVFLDLAVWIYLNDVKVVTLTTPWVGADVLNLRTCQSGNTMIVVHPGYPPYEIEHDPVANTWAAAAITFVNEDFYRFNTTTTLTPSATTGSITLTLSGSTPYWTSAHVGTHVRCNWVPNDPPTMPPSGEAIITSVDPAGLIASATTISDLSSTNADPAWSEWAWSAAHGYPKTATFFQDRLTFGGTRDAPSTVFASKSGDVFNFDDSETDDNFSYSFTLSTDQNEIISEIRSFQQALAIFTNVGEHLMQTTSGPVTPTNVYIAPQTNYGIGNMPSLQIEYFIFTVINNLKEVRSFEYQYYLQRYQTTSYTTIAQQLFKEGQFPISMTYLRDYADTQANYLFIAREDGQIAACAIDTEKNVLAWTRLTTQGSFADVCVARADHGNGVQTDTLYVLVQRDNGIFIEYLTETENYVDCYYTGTAGSPTTTWTGLLALENKLVQMVGDGTVQVSQTVSNSGSITLPNPVSTFTAGLEYDSNGETMPMVVSANGEQLRSQPISLAFCTFFVVNTQALNIGGNPVYFRNFGAMLLDQPLPSITGEFRVAIGGQPTILSPTLTFSVTEPLACTLLVLTIELNVGASR